MIYQPAISTDAEMLNLLILTDIVIYAYVYWLQENARESIPPPKEADQFDMIAWSKYRFGFYGNYRDSASFIYTSPLL